MILFFNPFTSEIHLGSDNLEHKLPNNGIFEKESSRAINLKTEYKSWSLSLNKTWSIHTEEVMCRKWFVIIRVTDIIHFHPIGTFWSALEIYFLFTSACANPLMYKIMRAILILSTNSQYTELDFC